MEGISTLTYKNQQMIYMDYSGVANDKQKAIQLIRAGTVEYMKNPKGSVVALVNVANLRFDSELMHIYKEEQDKSAPYEKKVAVIGLNTIQRIAYNFIAGSQKNSIIKAFDSEQAAKDWLVAD